MVAGLGLFDIGVSLFNLVLSLFSAEGDEEPESIEQVAGPVPVRLNFQVSPPYYEIPEISEIVTLANGLTFEVDIKPVDFPEFFAFLRNGGRHLREGVQVEETIDVFAAIKSFDQTKGRARLQGDISISAAPTSRAF